MGQKLCKIYAEYYKKELEKRAFKTDEEKENCVRNIRINEFLATCDEKDICALYDSALFNEITIKYAEKALEILGADPNLISDMRYEIKDLHEMLSAEYILKQ